MEYVMEYVTLNNGVEIPLQGYGVFQIQRIVVTAWRPESQGRLQNRQDGGLQ